MVRYIIIFLAVFWGWRVVASEPMLVCESKVVKNNDMSPPIPFVATVYQEGTENARVEIREKSKEEVIQELTGEKNDFGDWILHQRKNIPHDEVPDDFVSEQFYIVYDDSKQEPFEEADWMLFKGCTVELHVRFICKSVK